MTLSDGRRILQAGDGNRLCHFGKCGLASGGRRLGRIVCAARRGCLSGARIFDDHESGDANL